MILNVCFGVYVSGWQASGGEGAVQCGAKVRDASGSKQWFVCPCTQITPKWSMCGYWVHDGAVQGTGIQHTGRRSLHLTLGQILGWVHHCSPTFTSFSFKPPFLPPAQLRSLLSVIMTTVHWNSHVGCDRLRVLELLTSQGLLMPWMQISSWLLISLAYAAAFELLQLFHPHPKAWWFHLQSYFHFPTCIIRFFYCVLSDHFLIMYFPDITFLLWHTEE